MKTAVVTSSDKVYLDGVKALYASYKKNSNHEGGFYLLAHGDEEDFKDLKGINVLLNKDPINSPTSCNWPVKMPAMYSRLLIPKLFKDYDRVLFLDADTLILQDINEIFELDLGTTVCAGMVPGDHRVDNAHNNWMPFQFENPRPWPEYKTIRAIQAGVVLFDINNWNNTNLDEIIDKVLMSDLKFKFVVQGVLGFALRGNFTELHYKWNSRISITKDLKDVKILHYVGGSKINPWTGNIRYKKEWAHYFQSFEELT